MDQWVHFIDSDQTDQREPVFEELAQKQDKYKADDKQLIWICCCIMEYYMVLFGIYRIYDKCRRNDLIKINKQDRYVSQNSSSSSFDGHCEQMLWVFSSYRDIDESVIVVPQFGGQTGH